MFCTKCGKQIPDNANFCTGCGAQIRQANEMSQKNELMGLKPEQSQNQVSNNIPGSYQTDFSSQIERPQKTKENKNENNNKNKRTMIIVFIILIVLILVAVGLAVFYFKELDTGGRIAASIQKELENDKEDDKDEKIEEQEPEDDAEAQDEGVQDDAKAQDTEMQNEADADSDEEMGVVSDTNEVVKNTILPGVPKALYSYGFEETLGNAQIVVRNTGDTMPEVTSDIEPQYVSGMDGKAVYLDGSYGVQLRDVKKIGTSYTVAFWMKADDLCAWAPYIHIGYDLLDADRRSRIWLGQKEDGISVAPIISSERKVTDQSFEIKPVDDAVNSIEPGMWYHIVFTVDGNTKGSIAGSLHGTLYVSGRYAGAGNVVADTMNVDDVTVYLGINCWDRLYPVAFDDVKIWNQVLDEQQVLELFDAYQ